MNTTTKKPATHGRLIWIENGTDRVQVIKTGQFALLNFHKKVIKDDPQYANGILKITH